MSIPGYETAQVPNFDKGGMQLYKNLLGASQKAGTSGIDFLSRLASGSPDAFAALEAPAQTQFQKNLGQIGSRYSHLGARGSSAFENAISGAGAEMAENLASQRLGISQNAIDRLLNLQFSVLGLKPFTNFYMPEEEGIDWGKIIAALGGAAIGGATGGGKGALTGAQIGSSLF